MHTFQLCSYRRQLGSPMVVGAAVYLRRWVRQVDDIRGADIDSKGYTDNDDGDDECDRYTNTKILSCRKNTQNYNFQNKTMDRAHSFKVPFIGLRVAEWVTLLRLLFGV